MRWGVAETVDSSAHVSHSAAQAASITFEKDKEGDNGGEVIRAVVLKNGKTEAVDFNFVNVPPDKNNRKMGDIDFQNAKQARRTWLEANFTAHDPPPSRARQGPGASPGRRRAARAAWRRRGPRRRRAPRARL